MSWRVCKNLLVAAFVASVIVAPGSASADVLYDQSALEPGETSGVPDNNFSDDEANTDILADDFTVPPGQTWQLSGAEVAGFYSGGIAPPSPPPINVWIFADSGGLPGAQAFAATPTATSVGPNFSIPVTGAPPLEAGTWWLAVQYANGSVTTGPSWGWAGRLAQVGNEAAINQHFPLPPTCPALTWRHFTDCGVATHDLAFRLIGSLAPPAVTTAKRCKKRKHHKRHRKRCRKRHRKHRSRR
jgi:hypothetical protein